MNLIKVIWLSILAFIILTGCDPEVVKEKAAISTITVSEFEAHIKALSSDEFLGRKPFTIGEEKTIEYIRNEFMNMGLKPGNNGSYYQEVPMVEILGTPEKEMLVKGKGKSLKFEFQKDFVALTRKVKETVNVKDSELVFVGYGIVAPEYNWNDYDSVDVRGKTVVVLVNDPGFLTGDSTLFNGKSMTYYGRWSYKYEEAARQGAAGCLIVHDTEPASYPWQVVENGWMGAKLYLQNKDSTISFSDLEGWITMEAGKKLLEAAGQEEDLFSQALSNDFKAVPLGLSVSLKITNTFKNSRSFNVIAVYPGDEKADEYIFYTAHWDHLGIGPAVNGDSIYNGAIDNASGVAGLLEIADAFSKTKKRLKRSMVFLAVTAEEQGLLGSEYYSQNPIFSLDKTVAAINMDALGVHGRMKDLTVVGFGQSELDEYAEEAAKTQGRYIKPDPNPGTGSFYRSDHFNFAKVGVPALYAKGGYEHIEKGVAYADEKRNSYTKIHYHQPSDSFDPEAWDLSGMVEDTQLFYLIGRRLGNENTFPQWKEGSEFKSIREGYMGSQLGENSLSVQE